MSRGGGWLGVLLHGLKLLLSLFLMHLRKLVGLEVGDGDHVGLVLLDRAVAVHVLLRGPGGLTLAADGPPKTPTLSVLSKGVLSLSGIHGELDVQVSGQLLDGRSPRHDLRAGDGLHTCGLAGIGHTSVRD